MKKIKILLLVLSLGITNAAFAAGAERNTEAPPTLSTEISKFMKKHYIPLGEDLVVDVKFRVNDYREIVVLSENCDNPEVREYIAQSLNLRRPSIIFLKPEN